VEGVTRLVAVTASLGGGVIPTAAVTVTGAAEVAGGAEAAPAEAAARAEAAPTGPAVVAEAAGLLFQCLSWFLPLRHARWTTLLLQE